MPALPKPPITRPRIVDAPPVTVSPIAFVVACPSISTWLTTGWAVPSMVTGSVIVGSALASVMRGTPTAAIANVIVSAPTIAFASMIAWRSEPGPASSVVATRNVAARLPAGLARDRARASAMRANPLRPGRTRSRMCKPGASYRRAGRAPGVP